MEEKQGIRSVSNALHALCLVKCEILASSSDEREISSFKIRENMFNDQYNSMADLNLDIERLVKRALLSNIDFKCVLNELQKVSNSNYSPGRISLNSEEQEIMSNTGRSFLDAINDITDSNGRNISQIFMRLPAKNHFPDYYEEIKFPMTLSKISKKLNLNQYISICEILNDLTVCFRNAQIYNIEDSEIYRNAVILYQTTCKIFCDLLQSKEQICYVYNISTAQRHFFPSLKKDPEDWINSPSSIGTSNLARNQINSIEIKKIIDILKSESFGSVLCFDYYLENCEKNLKLLLNNNLKNIETLESVDDFIGLLFQVNSSIQFSLNFPFDKSKEFIDLSCKLFSRATKANYKPYYGPLVAFKLGLSDILSNIDTYKKILNILSDILNDFNYFEEFKGSNTPLNIFNFFNFAVEKNEFRNIFECIEFFGKVLNQISLNINYIDIEYFELIDIFTQILSLGLKCEREWLKYENFRKEKFNANACKDLVFWNLVTSTFTDFITNIKNESKTFFDETFKKSIEFFCQFDLMRELVFSNAFSNLKNLIIEFSTLLYVSESSISSLTDIQNKKLMENVLSILNKLTSNEIILEENIESVMKEFKNCHIPVFCREFYYFENQYGETCIAMLNEVRGRNSACQILIPTNSMEIANLNLFDNFHFFDNEFFLTDKTRTFQSDDLCRPVNVIPRHFARRLNDISKFQTVYCEFSLKDGFISQRIVLMPRYITFELGSKSKNIQAFNIENKVNFYSFNNSVEPMKKNIYNLSSIYTKNCINPININKFYKIHTDVKNEHLIYQIHSIDVKNLKLSFNCSKYSITLNDKNQIVNCKTIEKNQKIKFEEFTNELEELFITNLPLSKNILPVGIRKENIIFSNGLLEIGDEMNNLLLIKPNYTLAENFFNSSKEKIYLEEIFEKSSSYTKKQLFANASQVNKSVENLRSIAASITSSKRRLATSNLASFSKRSKIQNISKEIGIQTESLSFSSYNGPFIFENNFFKTSSYFKPTIFHSEIYNNFCNKVIQENNEK